MGFWGGGEGCEEECEGGEREGGGEGGDHGFEVVVGEDKGVDDVWCLSF